MLRVAPSQRTLVDADGRDFFYLGDTAWELFHRLTFAEACRYLDRRAAQGFTVIQAVVLAELDGIHTPNAQGDTPFGDVERLIPNEAYFGHIDRVVRYANQRGLYMGLLPTWGDKWNLQWGRGPVIFDVANAYHYGVWLGRRYATADVIWILGGDRHVETQAHHDIITQMAQGLTDGDGGTHLRTFHPMGQHSSSEYFHGSAWLDFNMLQSGHARNRDNWRSVADDYQRHPVKPCIDGEPGYEDHPAGFRIEQGYLDDYDARKACYWALCAGALGHTYGCHPVWQFWAPHHGQPATWARRAWHEALDLPGAGQMQHAKRVMLARNWQARIPDQGLICDAPSEAAQYIAACRDESGSYAIVYVPASQTVLVDMTRLQPGDFVAHWYDPRHGTWHDGGRVAAGTALHRWQVPVGGPDWVLVIDAVAAGWPCAD